MDLLRKTKATYTYLALLTTSSCLLIVFVNVVLFIYYETGYRGEVYGRQLSAENLKWLEEVYPQLDSKQIITMVTEKVSRPFVEGQMAQWREAPYSGTYVNVSEYGFRISKDQVPWPPNARTHLIVFLFGGSTMFGYGVEDEQTLASHFQTLLASTDSALPPAVYNFGQGNYNSTQELILFENLISRGFIPDLAIFMDGLNEFFISPEPLSRVALKRDVRMSYFVRELILRLPMTRAARSLRARMSSSRNSPESSDLNMPTKAESSLIKNVLDRYIATKSMIEAVSSAFGIDTVFVWQPVPTYKYDTQYHYALNISSNGFGRLSITGPGYEQMYRLKEERGLGESFLWCADIQENLAKPLYVDMWHFTGDFNGMVAECIYDSMRKKDSLTLGPRWAHLRTSPRPQSRKPTCCD